MLMFKGLFGAIGSIFSFVWHIIQFVLGLIDIAFAIIAPASLLIYMLLLILQLITGKTTTQMKLTYYSLCKIIVLIHVARAVVLLIVHLNLISVLLTLVIAYIYYFLAENVYKV